MTMSSLITFTAGFRSMVRILVCAKVRLVGFNATSVVFLVCMLDSGSRVN
jgi:hypothetical protein